MVYLHDNVFVVGKACLLLDPYLVSAELDILIDQVQLVRGFRRLVAAFLDIHHLECAAVGHFM